MAVAGRRSASYLSAAAQLGELGELGELGGDLAAPVAGGGGRHLPDGPPEMGGGTAAAVASGGGRHLPDGPPEMNGGTAGATTESSATEHPIELTESPIRPDEYSLLGRGLLSWNISLISRGWSTPLTPQRLPQLRAHLAAPKIGAEITRLWADERTKPAPSLRRALGRLLRQQILWGYAFGIVDGILSCVARPLVLRRLIQAIESEQPVDGGEGVLLILMVSFVVFVEAWFGVIYRHWLTEDVATAYIAGLFHLLLGKIAASPSAKEPLAAANKPAGDDGGPGAKGAEHVSEQPSESEEVRHFPAQFPPF